MQNLAIHQELEENGYVVIDFLNESEVQALLSFDQKHSPPNDLVALGMSFSIDTLEFSYRQLVTQEIKKLFTSKSTALFPEYRIMLCNFVCKRPKLPSSIMPLHQDPSLVDETSLKSFAIWCPLIDVNEQNGCLQVVKKSHLLNSKLRPFWAFDEFPYSQDILSLLQKHYLTSVPMKAGQALIYDKRLFHGSPPNTTTVERVAAVCSLVPHNTLTHFGYRESLTSDKLELFDVEDEFYHRCIVGQKPEGVKSLGIFNYEVEPLTPELLAEKLGRKNSELGCPNWLNLEISFQPQFLDINPSPQKIAILVSNEFEGFSKNGGIGTYYTTLSQKLASDGWYVILLLCQTEESFQGEAIFPHVDHVFSTHEIRQILNLQPVHEQILSQTQQDELSNSFDYQSFCCLFFTQAVIASFPDAVTYVEFPDIWGFGYRTVQAKKTGLLGTSCLIGATTHGCFEWLREVNSQHTVTNPQWFWLAYHYEQYSYENADVAYFPSYFLKSKLETYGWELKQANHLPYFVPIIELLHDKPTNLTSLPVIFFGRLEERKGFCTFVEAIKLLNPSIVQKIQIIFIGKIIPLQSSQYQHLDSQQYIKQQLDNYIIYKILPNLSSQEAIKFVSELNHPIACLTSLQENFPNTGLEMGQLPVSLVVSDTGGFRETLNLIERSDCVRYFQPGNPHSLAQTITQAVNAYPENPSIPERTFLEQVNQRLLNQKLEYMSQAFIDGAPKEPSSPLITIAIVCWHPVTTILECLESLGAQTYENFDVIVGYQNNEYVEEIIIQAKTKYPSCKYLNLDASWSLGQSYNYLVELAAGEYVLQLAPEHIPLPDTLEKLVTATITADADAVVCPTIRLGENGTTINLIDGCLLKLLEFNYNQDISALYSLKLLKEFPYCQERGLLALNWHIIAAAIATGKEIAYYPYPLYTSSTEASSKTVNIAKERYYIRQYLYQIESSKWNRRQLNLLLTGVEQLLQQQEQNKLLRPIHNEKLSPQEQAWMLTAQQIQDELTQTETTLKNIQAWNQELQAGKDWLETQWQTWMLRTQKAEVEWQRWQSVTNMMANSKFWRLRNAWLKLKNVIKPENTDPLELASQVHSDSSIQEYVTLIATQKVQYFQPEAIEAPVISIISLFSNDNQYFETTYRSVINQTWQNFEWIIVNDGSIDSSAVAFIDSLPQRTKKIKVLYSNNLGEAAALNTAIAEAKGEYLLFVNLVDIIDPLYIEKSLLFLESHPEFSFINSYSAVFQAQEYWWNNGFNKPALFFHENQVKGQLLYRKADFDKLGGFDEELKYHTNWERWTKAIANHQKGWTIPEYLNCSRCTTFVGQALEQNLSETRATQLIQSRYREFFTSTPPQEISLNRKSLDPQQLKVKIGTENQLQNKTPNKHLLFFFSSLGSDIDKRNLELITSLQQQGYKITIITTSTEHQERQSFYHVTPDIFQLPNFLDEVHWLAFTRYIIQWRQIDTVIISHADIAYYFLPLLRAEFSQVAFVDLTYNDSNFSTNGHIKVSTQFSQYLDRHILLSQPHDNVETEVILTEAINARQTSNHTKIDTELATVTLLLALKSIT